MLFFQEEDAFVVLGAMQDPQDDQFGIQDFVKDKVVPMRPAADVGSAAMRDSGKGEWHFRQLEALAFQLGDESICSSRI